MMAKVKEEAVTECCECGVGLTEDECISARNCDYCQGCYEDNYSVCDACNEVFCKDEIREFEGSYLCEDCLYDATFDCAQCDTITANARSVEVEGDELCEECARSESDCCYNCGITLYNDNLYTGRDDNVYCDSCYCADADSLRSCGYRPDLTFYRNRENEPNLKKNRFYMGVELEVDEGINTLDTAMELEDFVEIYCKEDGSLSEDGIEIVTHPATLDYHLSNMPWKEIRSICRKNNFTSHNNDECGLHIHVSKNRFTKVELMKLDSFITQNQDKCRILSRRRNDNWATYTHRPVKGRVKELMGTPKGRNAINLSNDRTVEFRLFRGTLRISSIYAAIEWVHAICHFVKTVNLLTFFNNEAKGWISFCDYVGGYRKLYPHLKDYMIEREVWEGRED